MPDPSKDFTPIRDDYEFFAENSTEAVADLDAYAERLRSFEPPAGPSPARSPPASWTGSAGTTTGWTWPWSSRRRPTDGRPSSGSG
jgi:hypothetical protein